MTPEVPGWLLWPCFLVGAGVLGLIALVCVLVALAWLFDLISDAVHDAHMERQMRRLEKVRAKK